MNSTVQSRLSGVIAEAQQAYLTKVYAWMVGGMAITGAVSWILLNSSAIVFLLENPMLIYMAMFAELGIVMGLSWALDRMNSMTASAAFVFYSALNGLTLAPLAFIYTEESLAGTFFICATVFGVMSVYGYTTKRDLSSLGSFLFMGLIGVILATVVNIFMESSAMNFAISVIGVLVFVGLTAYDTQKIKENYEVEFSGAEAAKKSAIMGALNLYLDFVNLFLFLLRLFGDRR